MKKGVIALGAAGVGAAVLLSFLLGYYFGRRTPPPKAPAVAPARVQPKEWSMDDIAADPEGYLAWADANIASQVKARQTMLKSIADSRAQWQKRKDEKFGDLADVESFLRRLETAFRRAEDEGRWPAMVGNRRFEREKAVRLLDELPKQIELRRPLAEEYDKTLAAMDERTKQLQSDIVALGHLREKIGLDVERVRLNRGVEELTKLSSSSREIDSFTKVLSSATPSSAPPPATGGEERIVDLETLLK